MLNPPFTVRQPTGSTPQVVDRLRIVYRSVVLAREPTGRRDAGLSVKKRLLRHAELLPGGARLSHGPRPSNPVATFVPEPNPLCLTKRVRDTIKREAKGDRTEETRLAVAAVEVIFSCMLTEARSPPG
jgi:hypothetical protein